MIYLDSAAIVKLIRDEPGSVALVEWLNTRTDQPLVSSALAEVEVPRALRRSAPQALVGVPSVLGRVYRLEISPHVRAIAGAFQDAQLRSPDAIHVATASLLATESEGDFTAFVTYDKRLLAAAQAQGMPTACPE